MRTIFWNVDTQYDFMRNDESFKGALHVPGAREIESNLEKITRYAEKNNIIVVNTADWHNENSAEFSSNPDYKTTFPPHCIEHTKGAGYIPATDPNNSYIIDWKLPDIIPEKVLGHRNITLYKDAFDIFKGSPHTEKILEILKPGKVIVYGVATNACVDQAVRGLLKKNYEVYVVLDAIKELPGVNLEVLFNSWKGAKFTLTKNIGKIMR